MLKYSVFSFCLFIGLEVLGQWSALPSKLRVGIDVIPMAKTFTDDEVNQFEIQGDLNLGKFFLNAEYGRADINREEGLYTTEGNYFRWGIDYNFLHRDNRENVLFIGYRFANSRYGDQLVFDKTDEFYGDISFESVNNDLEAKWGEIVTGLKVKMFKGLFFGYTLRYQLRLKIEGEEELISYETPGFGFTEEGFSFGMSYYLAYQIPFRKVKKREGEE